MKDADLKRIHCGLPVKITAVPLEARSERECLQFTCGWCGFSEEELRDKHGKLLQWRCLNVGKKHERRQVAQPVRESRLEWLRRIGRA